MTDAIQQAREAGASAREAGREMKPPMYGLGDAWRPLRDAWREGWIAQDAVEKRKPVLRKVEKRK